MQDTSLLLDRGMTTRRSFPLPEGATGAVAARAQVREMPTSPLALATWTTEAGTLDIADGAVSIVLPADTITAYPWDHGVWDLWVADADGHRSLVARGGVAIRQPVTRWPAS